MASELFVKLQNENEYLMGAALTMPKSLEVLNAAIVFAYELNDGYNKITSFKEKTRIRKAREYWSFFIKGQTDYWPDFEERAQESAA